MRALSEEPGCEPSEERFTRDVDDTLDVRQALARLPRDQAVVMAMFCGVELAIESARQRCENVASEWRAGFPSRDRYVLYGMTLELRALPPPPRDLLEGASLFLDFDGTLVEIASHHDAVTVETRLHRLMSRLSVKLGGRLAIVSGRSAESVHALFGSPAFAIAGSHGIELRWPNGLVSIPPRVKAPDVAIAEMQALRERHPGVVLEEKPFGVALHYRLAPEAEVECRALAQHLAEHFGWPIQTGKMVLELKLSDADKGTAVDAFMREPPMMGTRPIFVGDDETDEAGFVAAARAGGAGVLVGRPRATAAEYRTTNVEDTLHWLEAASGIQS